MIYNALLTYRGYFINFFHFFSLKYRYMQYLAVLDSDILRTNSTQIGFKHLFGAIMIWSIFFQMFTKDTP